MTRENLITRLQKRAAIRRQIQTRKSVQEGKPDRIADLLEEAALELTEALNLLKRARPDDAACVCRLRLGGCWPCETRDFLHLHEAPETMTEADLKDEAAAMDDFARGITPPEASAPKCRCDNLGLPWGVAHAWDCPQGRGDRS